MTARPVPTHVAHFTHVDHLTSMTEYGLLSDTAAHNSDLLTAEVGNLDIKDQRRQRAVPGHPRRTVAEHVPFYFAPRSPMMYSIFKGNVPSYGDGTTKLVYLLSSLERLHDLGYSPILTDRNAALAYAEYREFDPEDPIDDDFIDWPLMGETYWNNTLENPQRRERRMAEALVPERIAWDAITGIATKSDLVADEVRGLLAASQSSVAVSVRPHWYF